MIEFKAGSIKIEIDPLFTAILPFIILSGYFPEYLVILIFIMFHELGHIAATLLFNEKVAAIRLLPAGLNAIIEEKNLSICEKILIYVSGPLVNAVLIIICIIIDFFCMFPIDIQFFIYINTCLALFNLIPILPLDGGRVLREALSVRFGLIRACRFLHKISVFFTIVIVLFGIIQLIYNIHNFSFLVIGSYIYFTIKSEKLEAAIMNVKNIIYRRARFIKKGVYPVRDIVALKSVRLREVLKHMDFDRFHIIYVLDENMRPAGLVTEQELIDGMFADDAELTFEEFLKKKQERGISGEPSTCT